MAGVFVFFPTRCIGRVVQRKDCGRNFIGPGVLCEVCTNRRRSALAHERVAVKRITYRKRLGLSA